MTPQVFSRELFFIVFVVLGILTYDFVSSAETADAKQKTRHFIESKLAQASQGKKVHISFCSS